jgi:hypothetical protein
MLQYRSRKIALLALLLVGLALVALNAPTTASAQS